MADPRRTIFPHLEENKNPLATVTDATSTFFTGADDVYNQNFDPFVNGYSHLWWVKLPPWFEEDPDLKYFKQISQKNFRAFSGIDDVTLTTATHISGFAGNEIDVITGVAKGNTEFTIGHKEYSGGVMRRMYQKWIGLVRDHRTGLALYPKLFGIDYGARNHTGQLLYVSVRPDATNTDKDILEHAVFYSNVFPTNIPFGTLYNFELGTQDSPTIDISFKGYADFGPDVDEYARKKLKEEIIKTSTGGDNGINFIDGWGVNDTGAEILNDKVMKEIFNP